MYSLLKKHTNRLIATDKGSSNGSSIMRRYQGQLVQNMNSVALKMSKGCLVFSLSLFVIITGSIYGCIVSKSLSKRVSNTIPMNFISEPVDVLEKSYETLHRPFSVSSKDLAKIVQFRNYIDSLSSTQTGKNVYDSINSNCPGLLDRLVFIENYYKSNLKD